MKPELLPHLFDRYWQAKETVRLGTGATMRVRFGERVRGSLAKRVLVYDFYFAFRLPPNRLTIKS